MSDDGRALALAAALGLAAASWARGSAMRVGPGLRGPPPASPPDGVLPTGIPELDAVLGIGGWPRRVVELANASPDASPLAERVAARTVVRAIRERRSVVLVEVQESRIATMIPQDLGDDYHVAVPDTMAKALEVVRNFVRYDRRDLVVLRWARDDRLAEREASQALRTLAHDVTGAGITTKNVGTTLLVVTTHGGRLGATVGAGSGVTPAQALKFYSSVRVTVQWAPDDGGSAVRARVVKNKFFAPFQDVRFAMPPAGSAMRVGRRLAGGPRAAVVSEPMIVLSTAHLPLDEASRLADGSCLPPRRTKHWRDKPRGFQWVVCAEDEHGWFVYTGGGTRENTAALVGEGMPVLARVLQWAHDHHGATWVKFDEDGPQVEDLEVYPW